MAASKQIGKHSIARVNCFIFSTINFFIRIINFKVIQSRLAWSRKCYLFLKDFVYYFLNSTFALNLKKDIDFLPLYLPDFLLYLNDYYCFRFDNLLVAETKPYLFKTKAAICEYYSKIREVIIFGSVINFKESIIIKMVK